MPPLYLPNGALSSAGALARLQAGITVAVGQLVANPYDDVTVVTVGLRILLNDVPHKEAVEFLCSCWDNALDGGGTPRGAVSYARG